MGTIKLDKDEMLKIAGELSSLKEEVNNILNKTQETENVLRRETSVSTYSQRKKLNDVQDLAYNLVKKFDIISDDFYNAARTMDSVQEEILTKISFNRMNMGITMEKINNGENVEIKSPVPEEYSDYKDYFIGEEKALKLIFTSYLKLLKCKNIYSGSEIKYIPKRIAYRKDGYLYIYELKETPIYSLFGTDFYGDFGIYELTGDKEYADRFKKYQYVQVYSTEPEVRLGVVDVSSLKNIQNFRKGALEHIFEGEINRRGQAVGFHYEDYPTTRGEIVSGTQSISNEFGIYSGNVKVDGISKVANNGKSTFFPRDWTPEQVVDAINQAYINKQYVPGTKNTYIGKSVNGLKIEMYIDNKTNKIISAFPKY